jgi:hypothetical protein
MEGRDSFDRLARRDAQLHDLAARGRRRSLGIMVVVLVPVPFLVMLLNGDSSIASMIPTLLVLFGTVAYSWNRWNRRPEETQSVAFIGLDRKTRWSTYRSMWQASSVDDPIALILLEAMHDHLQRSFTLVIATIGALAVAGVALVLGSDGLHAGWLSLVIVVVSLAAIGELRWMVRRAAVVIDRSRAPLA